MTPRFAQGARDLKSLRAGHEETFERRHAVPGRPVAQPRAVRPRANTGHPRRKAPGGFAESSDSVLENQYRAPCRWPGQPEPRTVAVAAEATTTTGQRQVRVKEQSSVPS